MTLPLARLTCVQPYCPASGNVSSINTLSIEYWQWMASQSHCICVMPQPTNINKVEPKFCFVVVNDLWEFRFWDSVSPDCSIYSAQTSNTATLHCSGVWVAIACHWSLMIATMWPKLAAGPGNWQTSTLTLIPTSINITDWFWHFPMFNLIYSRV